MIINIEDTLYNKVVAIVKSRNIKLYEQLQQIQPLQNIDTLQTARDIKTNRIKIKIISIMEQLHKEDIKLTKYQIHKRSGIAYITINKYFKELYSKVINNEC